MKPAEITFRNGTRNSHRAPAIPTPLQARLVSRAAGLNDRQPGARELNGSSMPCDGGSGRPKFKIVVLGLSITSSWGNGHATTYRGLIRELATRGHEVLFLERDANWYASNRDMPNPSFCRTAIYDDFKQLKDRYASAIRDADLVMVGSYVPGGAAIGEWVTRIARGATAFYDIDTPVTLANLRKDDLDYLTAALIPKYDMYLSFTGGPTLDLLEERYHSPMARPLYCSVDTSLYYPEQCPTKWDFGYMGTYSDDRQPALDELLLKPARHWEAGRFVVAGPQYPKSMKWPKNVRRYIHLSPAKHRAFYCAQKFTLNVTRADMVEAGYSPSVRLFEAAACGTPIISDFWPGLDSFFAPNSEILISNSSEESLYYLLSTSDTERKSISSRARRRVLATHTARHRAFELESYVCDVLRPTIGTT